ncbi:hypothetical protein GCM10010112_73010 [Actinoplanes lobatus]|uniref:Uncharacterized protein n=1 Tax=Actinoplanes lobatus TaxID=113568 RepID=A0A7W7MLW1_9ACTN|nr:hypothetical protein [Actinoplanes lobatus]MBB4755179.1 hypothetical protein [Actinoplanes lobatus]GGN88990.1 hypothetical protein GCM10010112_73010 [Actinoplanes lobatus]GIE43385.1 hypothetical protein Alo02nite_62830 [Actinoplanes lobatus]
MFATANERVTSRLDRMPTTHEETLDFAFIDALVEARGPHLTMSGTVVDIDAHFVGGGWHWQRWEIADLGLIINFRQRGNLLRTKVVLLQSKRLYPREAEFTEDLGLARPGGFGSLMAKSLPATVGPRVFRFDDSCRYRALQVGDDQWQSIAKYETTFGLPIHYMLYHPRAMPSQSSIPVQLPFNPPTIPLVTGSRVMSASAIRASTSHFSRNYAPAFGELRGGSAAPGAPIQDFIVDEVLACHEGYVVDDGAENEGLVRVFSQRGAPIAAAVRIDIDLPG